MDEHIRLLKQQAFHEGYIAGYQRGIEDGRAGARYLLTCSMLRSHF